MSINEMKVKKLSGATNIEVDAPALDLLSNPIINLAAPSADADATNKIYVDTAIAAAVSAAGAPATVDAATAAALPAYTPSGGVLTATGNGALVVDDQTMSNGQLVLVKSEFSNPQYNGIYDVTDAGSVGTPFILTRNANFDVAGDFKKGLPIFVATGTLNGNLVFNIQESPSVLDTDPIAFTSPSKVLDGGGFASVDSNSRILSNGSVNVLDYSALQLQDNSGNGALNWSNRNLYDSSASSIMDWSNSAGINFQAKPLTNLADPSNPQDAMTLAYFLANSTEKPPIDFVQISALPSNTYLSGVLTATANGVLSVDGGSLSVGQRLIITGEVTSANNGVYVVTDAGSVGTPYILTRASDMLEGSQAVQGTEYVILNGSTYQFEKFYIQGSVTVGSGSLSFGLLGVGRALQNLLPFVNSIIPAVNNTYDVGSPSNNVRDVYIADAIFWQGYKTIDVSGVLFDTSAVASVLWMNREVRDSSNKTAESWQDRRLYYNDGTTIAYDWQNGSLNDSSGNVSVGVAGRTLATSSGNSALDWQNSQLFDNTVNNFLSVDYNARLLKANDGSTTALDYSSPGTLGVNGALISNVADPVSAQDAVTKVYADKAGVWTKYTFAAAAFSAAALTNSITLFTLPGGGIIEGIIIKHSTAFAGTSITAVSVEVGLSGQESKYASAFDVFQTVANTTLQSSQDFYIEDMASSTNVLITATSVGANLSALSAGSVDVWVKTSQIA